VFPTPVVDAVRKDTKAAGTRQEVFACTLNYSLLSDLPPSSSCDSQRTDSVAARLANHGSFPVFIARSYDRSALHSSPSLLRSPHKDVPGISRDTLDGSDY